MSQTLEQQRQAWRVLIAHTLAFTVSFMVWMMFGVIAVPIGRALQLSATQVGLLMAAPILVGSLVRLPLGLWSDRSDSRHLTMWLLAAVLPGLWWVSQAQHYWQFLLAGCLIGLSGGQFAIGTPAVARWFARSQQGMAMGFFGSGNAGAGLNQIAAPVLLVAFGWSVVPQVYALLLLLSMLAFWVLSLPRTAAVPSPETAAVPIATLIAVPTAVPTARTAAASAAIPKLTWRQQLEMLRDPRVLRYCQHYSVVFGGFVALTLWLVQHYVAEYGLNIRNAALMAVLFTLPGGLLRGLGGVLADRYGAHRLTVWVLWISCICLFLLSFPPAGLTTQTGSGPISLPIALPLNVGLSVEVFSALLLVLTVAWSFGRASVFKYISDDYPDALGAVTGVVGLVGGVAGCALLILFGMLLDGTGLRSSAFMLLFGCVCLSLLWNYWAMLQPVDGPQRTE